MSLYQLINDGCKKTCGGVEVKLIFSEHSAQDILSFMLQSLNPVERPPGTYYIRSLLGPKSGLSTMGKIRMPCPRRESYMDYVVVRILAGNK
jgi:hypothetical protein